MSMQNKNLRLESVRLFERFYNYFTNFCIVDGIEKATSEMQKDIFNVDRHH